MSKFQLRIPDYDKNIQDTHCKRWTPLESYAFGQRNNSGNQGKGSYLEVGDVSLYKAMDKLSPLMAQSVATGQEISQLVIFQEGFPPGSPYAFLSIFGHNVHQASIRRRRER